MMTSYRRQVAVLRSLVLSGPSPGHSSRKLFFRTEDFRRACVNCCFVSRHYDRIIVFKRCADSRIRYENGSAWTRIDRCVFGLNYENAYIWKRISVDRAWFFKLGVEKSNFYEEIIYSHGLIWRACSQHSTGISKKTITIKYTVMLHALCKNLLVFTLCLSSVHHNHQGQDRAVLYHIQHTIFHRQRKSV